MLFGGVKKFGYMNVGKKMNEVTIVNEEQRPLVESLFRIFNLQSTTNFKICMDKWNNTHNLLWKTTMIKKTLKWEGYKGEISKMGNENIQLRYLRLLVKNYGMKLKRRLRNLK